MKVAIRDDDTSYFTKPKDLQRAYDFLNEDDCVSLSVVPYTVPVHRDDVFPYGKEIGMGYYDIAENTELLEYLKEKYKSLLPLDKKVPHRTFLVYNTWTNEVMVEKRVEKSKKSIYQKLQQVCSPHLAQIEEIVELDNECRIFELYISGESLKTKLERGVLTPQEVRKYSCMLLDLLEELQ